MGNRTGKHHTEDGTGRKAEGGLLSTGSDETEEVPTCSACGCPDFLVFESAVLFIDAGGEHGAQWDLSYWCSNCESFYGHGTRVPPTQELLATVGHQEPVFTHCGRPMHHGSGALEPTKHLGDAELLWCDCGFSYLPPQPIDGG